MSLSMMNECRMIDKIEHEGYELNDFWCFFVDDYNVIRHIDASKFFMNDELYSSVLGFGLKMYFEAL